MAPRKTTSGGTPPVAGKTSVAVEEPPTGTPQVADKSIAAPENGLVVATAGGELKTVKLCRKCGVELPPDWPHGYCETCHQEWLAEQRREAEARLPRSKAFCSGQTVDGKPCRRVVDRGPDGRPRPCLKCDATRVLLGAKASIAEADSRGWDVLDEARAKMAEAEECFLDTRYWDARNAARAVHHLQARARVEYRLHRIPEARLSSAELAEYGKALQLYEAEEYFEANRALNVLRDVGRHEQRSRELAQIVELAELGSLDPRLSDRGGRHREQDQRRREKSERDREIRAGMKGHNPSPPQGRGRR